MKNSLLKGAAGLTLSLLLGACDESTIFVDLPPSEFISQHSTQLCGAGARPSPSSACTDFEGFLTAYPEAANPDDENGLSSVGLARFIEVCHLRTLEDLLARLPLPLRQNYVFMRASSSRQASTPTLPRAILYSSGGTFALTFGGNNELPAGTDLEIMEWNEATARFSLAFLSFAQGAPAGSATPTAGSPDERCRDAAAPVLPVTLTREPRQCVGCHGPVEHTRPLWAMYNLWHGAYGSVSDGFNDYIQVGSREAREYAEFLRTQRFQGRYAYLPAPLPLDQQRPLEAEAPGDIIPVFNANVDLEQSAQPVSFLLDALLPQNAKRVTARLLESADQTPWVPFIAAMARNNCLNPCDGMEHIPSCAGSIGTGYAQIFKPVSDFLPPIEAAQYISRVRTWIEQLEARGHEQSLERFAAILPDNPVWESYPRTYLTLFEPDPDLTAVQVVTAPYFALAETLGTDFTYWSMEPNLMGDYNLLPRRDTVGRLATGVRLYLNRHAPELLDMDCAELAAASRAAFGGP